MVREALTKKRVLGVGCLVLGLALVLSLIPDTWNPSPAVAQQVTLSGPFALTGQCSTTAFSILYQTDFESEDPDLTPTWTGATANATLNTNPSFSYGGTDSGQYYYNIAAGGSPSLDSNQYSTWISSTPQSHFFLRGRVYFKTPEVGLDTFIVQRKLLWFSDSTSSGVSQVDYAIIINSWTGTGGSPTPSTIYLSFGGNATGCSGPITSIYDITTMTWDTWYTLEAEIQLNTLGNADGILRIWKNGTQVFSQTDINYRGTCAANVSYFSVGRQTNRTNSEAIEEYRYWDDVKISTGYIGP